MSGVYVKYISCHTKRFDKVWRDGILFKLKQNGMPGSLLNLLSNLFLKKQKVDSST